MKGVIQASGEKRFLDGYFDDQRLAGANHLSDPSCNVDILKSGEAVYRKGIIQTEFDLANAGKGSLPFHIPRYNVTFFSINGKVLFVNHNNSDAVVDTGISLTETDGRKTMFGEYAGDIYLTNTTDGLRQIHMGRVNDASAAATDGTITVDQDLAMRLIAFSDTTSSLRIANTSPFAETMASVANTGVVTLANTLNADVPDNTIVYTVEDISSGKPKAAGIGFWEERMVLWGVVSETTADTPTNIVYFSVAATVAALENIINFTIADGSGQNIVAKGDVVTAVLPVRDYIYIFTKTETYFAAVSDMNRTTGSVMIQLLSNKYGCLNKDCVVDMGNGLACFLTNNKRVIGIGIGVKDGQATTFPIETFDSPISKTLPLLDTDQSDSFFFYAPNDHRAYLHLTVDSNRVVFKYNTEIQKMEPPTTGWSMGGMYIRDGVTFATALTDDTVWQLNEGFQDAGIDYEVVIATSLVEAEDGRITLKLKSVGVSGRASELATVTVESYVGGGTPLQKSFTVPSGGSSGSLGTVTLGTTALGTGIGTELVEFDKLFGVSPTYGSSYQLCVRSVGAISLSSYTIYGSALSRPLLTLS